MTKAIRIYETGAPEVMKWEEIDLPAPGEGQIRVRQTAIGVNFIDTYFRDGTYPAPSFPFTPGKEGAGIVDAVGAGVSDLKEGDRVAYAAADGSYAEELIIEAAKVVPIPDGVSDETAAGMMLKGMTAEYLLNRTFKVARDTTLLFHAAAGGVGLIAGQWARHLGATVIGTAGSPEKCELAKANGYDHVINYREEDFVERVADLTDGKKCDVVYDSVGKDTFEGSLDCVKRLGMIVTFGQSSGVVPPVSTGVLNKKGSLFLTRPSLFNYTATREELLDCAKNLFSMVKSGAVKIEIGQTYPLSEAVQAHRDLQGRKTTGTTILTIG
ncbi:quinone oxidoreductase [Fulvimarina pelagi HTCC2506]|uniref:Quinone oxidoreductase n=1 Tax=Fulvimarina pelagi HTCC2506 TaxID=314231 RepID=Q0G6S7_9HYPH|nr:quinone oxidoreductase [Fulvimarina pelagi]EAU42637.1 quinone oxidoreductase [Fulvimarina pelagi HTCC2506]